MQRRAFSASTIADVRDWVRPRQAMSTLLGLDLDSRARRVSLPSAARCFNRGALAGGR
eukprot:SAG31_NODE_32419_length_356_cov_0.789883_1_plen_57_part_10